VLALPLARQRSFCYNFGKLIKGVLVMAKDDITGKHAISGNNVSFSMRHTKRTFKPNLQKRTLVVNGKKVRLTVAASTIRTLRKKGFLVNGSDLKVKPSEPARK
jgi:large subunit ribosomal protein L28